MFLLFFCLKLEGIADGEVQGLHILEAAKIEIAIAIRERNILWIVEGEAPIDANDEESKIIAQTDACADSDIIEEARRIVFHHMDKSFPSSFIV